MDGWLKKLRGFLGLSATGFGVGAVFGSSWALVSGLLGTSALNPGTFFWAAGLWGVLGGVATGGVGVALAVLNQGRRADELSVWKAGLYGMCFGAVAPLLLIGSVMLVTEVAVQGVLTFVGLSSAVGAVLGSGVVAAAKSAASREVAVPGEPDSLPPRAAP